MLYNNGMKGLFWLYYWIPSNKLLELSIKRIKLLELIFSLKFKSIQKLELFSSFSILNFDFRGGQIFSFITLEKSWILTYYFFFPLIIYPSCLLFSLLNIEFLTSIVFHYHLHTGSFPEWFIIFMPLSLFAQNHHTLL